MAKRSKSISDWFCTTCGKDYVHKSRYERHVLTAAHRRFAETLRTLTSDNDEMDSDSSVQPTEESTFNLDSPQEVYKSTGLIKAGKSRGTNQ